MKTSRWLLLTLVLFFGACTEDPEETIFPIVEDYDIDADIDAPVVSCDQAVDLLSVTIQPAFVSTGILGMSFSPGGVGLAIDRNRNFWRVTNNGAEWNTVIPNIVNAVGQPVVPHYVDEQTLYVTTNQSGGGSGLLRSDDSGDTFFAVNNNGIASGEFIRDLYFETPERGAAIITNYAVPANPEYKLVVTTDGARNWSEIMVPGNGPMLGFAQVEGAIALIRTDLLAIRNGDSWDSRPYGEPSLQRSEHLCFDGRSGGLLYNNNGQLFSTENGGRSWQLSSEDFVRVDLIRINDDGASLILGQRNRVVGGDQLVNNGMLIYERLGPEQDWDIEKTAQVCGLRGSYFLLPSGRTIVFNAAEMSFLDW